ncbi:unnamed protein product [Brugia pahangi]|uniref:Uncharacterized protein n=1 Tax=Brugia pahangi TaxID=6280 RepID=A0A0N4T6V6_BRUPA|nr:unnamed protein product [Brugia pahangi]
MSLGSERRWVGNYRLRQYAVNPPIYLVEKGERIKNNVLPAQSMRPPCAVYFEIRFAYSALIKAEVKLQL